MEPIFVHFIAGPPVKVPTIVLVFTSFMAGMVVTLFFTIASKSKKKEDEDEDE
ncbi:MAG: hypothetical protein HQK84_08990 [Nitrospinae bacterium]|nr:hypothetical protein [Nitrospinota bacterium]